MEFDGRIEHEQPSPNTLPRSVRVGTFSVGRLGFGARWVGTTSDADSTDLLHAVVDAGVTYIDTADVYGNARSELLIGKAVPPESGVKIGTKVGLTPRPGKSSFGVNATPNHIVASAHRSRERLRRERLDLYQLHRLDPKVPLRETFGAFQDLLDDGVIDNVGLSEVSIEQLREISRILPIASVQNLYNVHDRQHEPMLSLCEKSGTAFLPWYPLGYGRLDNAGGLATVADRYGATRHQVALAWLMHRSAVILPIPGTSSPVHLLENVAAASMVLDRDDIATLDGLWQGTPVHDSVGRVVAQPDEQRQDEKGHAPRRESSHP